MVEIRKANGRGECNPQTVPGSELTKTCWGTGETLHRGCSCSPASHSKQGGVSGPVDMAELILCWLQSVSGFLDQIQSTEHLQDCAISPQPYKYILNTFGNKKHFRWTHSMCKTARALPHFAFSQTSLWIWWIKPEIELIQIHRLLLKCLLNSDPGHQREHWTAAMQEDFLV